MPAVITLLIQKQQSKCYFSCKFKENLRQNLYKKQKKKSIHNINSVITQLLFTKHFKLVMRYFYTPQQYFKIYTSVPLKWIIQRKRIVINESMNDLRSSLSIQTLDALMRLQNMMNNFSVTQVQDITSIWLKRGKRRIQLT